VKQAHLRTAPDQPFLGLHSPDQLDEHFLRYLARIAEEMKPGEILTIDITSHRY
jgi:hypothetical protein